MGRACSKHGTDKRIMKSLGPKKSREETCKWEGGDNIKLDLWTLNK
jgi:hypothetical protein